MQQTLQLPPHYRLIAQVEADSVMTQARLLAEQGAEEGTLLWLYKQTAGQGRLGQTWQSAPGNLYCALLLEPDYSAACAAQLMYVAKASLRASLANFLPPLAELRYRWPNDIFLNEGKVASIWLDAPAGDPPKWLVLGFAVNVANHPESDDFSITSSAAEGTADITPAAILEGFSRHFLTWINRWADEGLTPVLEHWKQHTLDPVATGAIGQTRILQMPRHSYHGTVAAITDDGAIVFAEQQGGRHNLSIASAFPCFEKLS